MNCLRCLFHLKGTVSLNVWQKLHLGPLWAGKNGFTKFFFFAKKYTKNMCPHSRWLNWHGGSKDKGYTDTMSAWLLTTLTLCQCSQRLCGPCVRTVNNYVDTGQCSQQNNKYVDTFQWSQRLRWHTVNYFTSKKVKIYSKKEQKM